MKLKITMELEIGDLTDEQRAELEDGINFRAVEDTNADPDMDVVPTLAEQDPDEIICVLREYMKYLWDDPDAQDEIWAGSEVYALITKVNNVTVEQMLNGTPEAHRFAKAVSAMFEDDDKWSVLDLDGAKAFFEQIGYVPSGAARTRP